jgi:hypothetical protein
LAQSVEQLQQRPHWQFKPGVSGNPHPWGSLSNAEKARRIEAKARELSDGAFDKLSARDRELMIQVATLKLLPKRRGEDPIRRINSISRLLGRVRGLRSTSPSFDEALR